MFRTGCPGTKRVDSIAKTRHQGKKNVGCFIIKWLVGMELFNIEVDKSQTNNKIQT